MRETRSSGSVQGAVSNHGPYCDHFFEYVDGLIQASCAWCPADNIQHRSGGAQGLDCSFEWRKRFQDSPGAAEGAKLLVREQVRISIVGLVFVLV